MAITDKRIFHDGEKFVGKYHGKIYHAVATATKEGLRFVVNGSKTEHRTLSGAGSAVFGLNKAGKPRTCNGFAFWSRAEDATPKAAKSKTPKATKPATKTAPAKAKAASA